MTDAVLADNDRKEELSYAYLSALSAMAGYTCERGPVPDRDSVDASLKAGGLLRPQIDVQLKATSSASRSRGNLHFRLARKNYDDLRILRMCPIILVVLELPEEQSDWLQSDAERLILRRCARWLSLRGHPEIAMESTTVYIPESQLLDVDELVRLMDLARQGSL